MINKVSSRFADVRRKDAAVHYSGQCPRFATSYMLAWVLVFRAVRLKGIWGWRWVVLPGDGCRRKTGTSRKLLRASAVRVRLSGLPRRGRQRHVEGADQHSRRKGAGERP